MWVAAKRRRLKMPVKYDTRKEILSDLNTMIEAGTLPARAISSLADAVDLLENTRKCLGCGKMSTTIRNSCGTKVSTCCHKIVDHS
jgi:hypothetical protein